MAKVKFSSQLDNWLRSSSKKSLQDLSAVFKEKTFAIVILILMIIPATPLPTGGITHVFELVVMLLSVELMLGRRTIWLPKRWRQWEMGASMRKKTIPFIVRRVRFIEKFSRPRLNDWLNHPLFLRFVGFFFFLFALTAFLAPPFSGLDTIPALAAVLVALSLILGDAVLFVIGIVVGLIGIGVVIALGGVTLSILKHFW